MSEETLPGAALEAPESFRVVLAPLWPRLLVALGYQGAARWVALYISSDHAIYNDGSGLGSSGDTGPFLAYKRHLVVAPHLAGAHLGSADEEARDWLLIDAQQQMLYLAACDETRRFLATQWPRYEAPLEYTQAELAHLMDDWEEVALPVNWRDRLAEGLRESRANYRLMKQWLDEH
jgi:hypothetical protein